ncbi:hypothetical protein AB0J86_15050 [Micromonospora sp. NPDC049559]|uniref:hypothetical protein n=1 Tax=Micromonospora sp. NPDC049559 TaxID=3155923 RepID=UPI00342AC588
MTGPAEPMLAEVVLERHGRILATYQVRRDVRGDWVLLDQGRAGVAGEGLRPDGVDRGWRPESKPSPSRVNRWSTYPYRRGDRSLVDLGGADGES